MDIEQGSIAANGVEFAYLATGPANGPLALCLHGFPDTAHTYRRLLPALAAAGYRAVAPWLRGYAPTSIPEDGRYGGPTLALDAVRLHEALGGGPDAVLIGHDWGATAVYPAGAYAPERFRRLVAMAVPPGRAMGGLFGYDQIKRSFYMWFFQLPLADFIVPANEMEFVARLWQDWSPGYDATADVAHVRESIGAPAHLAAALGYYRATFGTAAAARTEPGTADPEVAAVEAAGAQLPAQPLLYLHGAQDGCIGVELGRAGVLALTAPSRGGIVEGAGHFLHLERPQEVNAMILDFLAEP